MVVFIFYNVSDVNYVGCNDDFDRIIVVFEVVLLDEMIVILLFILILVIVYSVRVKFEVIVYYVWMGWGGLKYMYFD